MSGVKLHESGGDDGRSERLQRHSADRLAADATTILLTTCALIDGASRCPRIGKAREKYARNRAATSVVKKVDWGGQR